MTTRNLGKSHLAAIGVAGSVSQFDGQLRCVRVNLEDSPVFGKGRAQRLMSPDQVAHCVAQRTNIKLTAQVKGDRFIVGQRGLRSQPVGQPDLALGFS